jgi:hypothetical protein
MEIKDAGGIPESNILAGSHLQRDVHTSKETIIQ